MPDTKEWFESRFEVFDSMTPYLFVVKDYHTMEFRLWGLHRFDNDATIYEYGRCALSVRAEKNGGHEMYQQWLQGVIEVWMDHFEHLNESESVD